MNGQDLTVAAIVGLAAAWLVFKLYRAIRKRCRPADSGGGCGNCGKCG
ncbi:hypothetical protein [Magnetospirillum aberrantis]|uniref:FeoB-associated Cys-rich membrane protein n=1 Tax=Magnetospirillum aberrantis SpK TaxID=908842 RepID=A0A7C9QU04_9PROT|nr:hypothetical protein [Magnetospirillum aberrantis]NFV80620.1 hypothetical protein [Magnetospirillum aberrantis SpK]